MKERPILFSGPMVRAILEDRKLKTRRVMTPQPGEEWWPEVGTCAYEREDGDPGPDFFGAGDENECYKSRYGAPGDRLWVREMLRFGSRGNPKPALNHMWWYAADNQPVTVDRAFQSAMVVWAHHKEQDYCPSIFMPRWASRITLEITDVRVQRVQEISLEDCLAEGIDVPGRERMLTIGPINRACDEAHCRAHFSQLWDSINAKRGFSWESNPWVWALTFKRLTSNL